MFFFSSRRRHTRYWRDWSSDVCSSDLRGLENTSRTIRLPVHVAQRSRKVGRVERELTTKLGHEPTDEEIAMAADLPLAEVIEIRKADRAVVSLDKPVGDEGDTSLGELLSLETASVHDEVADAIRS